MKTTADDPHILGGSYALDALGPQETEAFERHLQHCPTCAAEVRGLRETAARLGLARPVPPPAAMRPRVLAATYQTRQLPPLAAGPDQAARHRRPLRAWRHPRPLLAAAAAVAAAAIAFGVTEASVHHPPNATVATARARTGGTVTLTVIPGQPGALLTAARLPDLPDGRVYQVWLMSAGQARPAGFLSGTALVLTGLRPGERIGVTIEPAGGTRQPSTAPIVSLPVPA